MIDNGLCERIKRIRKKNNLTQNKFASKIDISRSLIAQIEKGYAEPSKNTIKKIVQILNINGSWLLTGKGDMFIKENKQSIVPDYCDIKCLLGKDERIEQLKKELSKMKRDLFSLEKQNKELNTELMDKLKELLSLKDKLLEERV